VHKCDFVVFSPSFNFVSFFKDSVPIFIAKVLNIKYILWIHGNGLKSLFDNSNKLLKKYIKILFEASFFTVPVAVKIVEQNYNFFANNDKIRVIYNGIDDIESQLILEKNNQFINILFLSNMILTKGWKLLFDVAELICEKNDKINFIFAGQITSDKSYVFRTFSETRFKERIQYVGPKYGIEKEKLLKNADIFCFPTYYPLETFGIVNLEAMKYSLPIITSNIGGISEVVIDRKGGFVLNDINVKNLLEKVELLINDSELRINMGRYNKQRFEKEFTLNRTVSSWINLLIQA